MLSGYLVQLDVAAAAPIYMVAKQGTNFIGIPIGAGDNSLATYSAIALDPNTSPKAVYGKLAVIVTP